MVDVITASSLNWEYSIHYVTLWAGGQKGFYCCVINAFLNLVMNSHAGREDVQVGCTATLELSRSEVNINSVSLLANL